MSRRQEIQSAEGIALYYPGIGVAQQVSETTPTNGVAGYAKGCTWQNLNGTAGTLFYINQGTVTSATWFALA